MKRGRKILSRKETNGNVGLKSAFKLCLPIFFLLVLLVAGYMNMSFLASVDSLSDATSGGVTVAYAVVVTSCTPAIQEVGVFPMAEAAAVLKHSIARATKTTGNYGYKMYALYHPNAEECAKTLEPIGYEILERDTPIKVADIRGDFLRERIMKNGCCGEKELIKFEAFTLTQHPVVVLLDMDVLILKPLDNLFDLILEGTVPENKAATLMWPEEEIPKDINVLYTRDYAMSLPGRTVHPFQGGFSVLKPDLNTYEEFRQIVLEGDFRDRPLSKDTGIGWGGITGKFWGAQTFQGLMPYYYGHLHPGKGVELNWCVFNNMASPNKRNDLCFNGQPDCEDCRERPFEDIVTTHFTVCEKPWTCQRHTNTKAPTSRLCRQLHHAWFEERSKMERSWGRSGMGEHEFEREHFFGNCHSSGQKGYTKVETPYGTVG